MNTNLLDCYNLGRMLAVRSLHLETLLSRASRASRRGDDELADRLCDDAVRLADNLETTYRTLRITLSGTRWKAFQLGLSLRVRTM